MLGDRPQDGGLFQCVTMEDLVPTDHLLRRLRATLDFSFAREIVAKTYSHLGRPSYDPEVVVRIWMLQQFYGFSERQICDEMRMHAGYRWFCGLCFNDPVPDQSTLVKLRQRFAPTGLWERVLSETVRACEAAGIAKSDRMGLDGTLIRANAAIVSMEEIPSRIELHEEPPGEDGSVKVADDSPPVDLQIVDGGRDGPSRKSGDRNFHNERFTNDTHQSTTDPEARLYRKSRTHEAHLSHMGHYLADLHSGVIFAACATQATGTAEREAGLALLDSLSTRPSELVMDKGYRDGSYLAELRKRDILPIVPMSDQAIEAEPTWQRQTLVIHRAVNRRKRRDAARARNLARVTARTRRAAQAQRQRTVVERLFAEAKVCHGMRRAQRRGLPKLDQQVKLTAAVQNIKRLLAPGRRPAIAQAQALTQTLLALRRALQRLRNGSNRLHTGITGSKLQRRTFAAMRGNSRTVLSQ